MDESYAWKASAALGVLVIAASVSSGQSLPSSPAPKAVAPKATFEFRSHRIGDRIETKYPNWQQGKPELFKPGCDTKQSDAGIIACDV